MDRLFQPLSVLVRRIGPVQESIGYLSAAERQGNQDAGVFLAMVGDIYKSRGDLTKATLMAEDESALVSLSRKAFSSRS